MLSVTPTAVVAVSTIVAQHACEPEGHGCVVVRQHEETQGHTTPIANLVLAVMCTNKCEMNSMAE